MRAVPFVLPSVAAALAKQFDIELIMFTMKDSPLPWGAAAAAAGP